MITFSPANAALRRRGNSRSNSVTVASMDNDLFDNLSNSKPYCKAVLKAARKRGTAADMEEGFQRLRAGDAFVASRPERDRIRAATGADLVDMNSFGAALACEKSKIPLVLLKFRSDAADDAAANDFKKFIAAYQGRYGGSLRQWIETLPASPQSPQASDNIRRLLE